MGIQQMIYAMVAAVIAGLVLLSMYGVQLRGRQSSVDAVQYRTAKANVLSIVEIVERDFNNLGAFMYWDGASYVGTDLDPEDVLQPKPSSAWYDPTLANWYDSTSVSGGYRTWLQFVSQSDSLQPPVRIRYQWEPVSGETITLKNGTVRQLYRVRRFTNGASTLDSKLFTGFRITPLTDESVPIMINLHQARRFRVTMRMISPLGKSETIEENAFDAIFRPTALTIKQ